MPDENETRDATWQLLKKAREVEPEPFFAQEMRRIAAATPQGFSGQILAWLGIGKARQGNSEAGPAAGNGNRLAFVAMAVGVLAAVATTTIFLNSRQQDARVAGATRASQETQAAASTGGMLASGELGKLEQSLLRELPEAASLEKEIDETADLLQLASTLDVSHLGDDDIEALLF